MATAAQWKKRGQPDGFPAEQLPLEEHVPQGPAPKRRRSTWKRLLAAFAVFVVLVWLLPSIVANSPLLNPILGSVAADLKGKVTARSASLGWLSSLKLSGIEICDEQGQTLLDVPEIRGDRSLLAILWDSSNLGRIRLEKPTLSVVLREDGSNVEDVLASYLAESDEPLDAMGLDVEIVDGSVSISDPRAQQSWQVDGFQLRFSMAADPAGPIALQASGAVANADRPGSFSVNLKMQDGGATGPPPNGSAPAASREMTIETKGLPLALFQSLCDRFALDVQLAGHLSSSIQCRSTGREVPGTIVIQGSATADHFTLSAPSLGSDQLAFGRFQATCQAAWQEGRLQVDRLDVKSDAGTVSLAGRFELQEDTAENVLAWLPTQKFEVGGQIDLARLAAMLPATLRIREGTQVTSGGLQLGLASRPGRDGMHWQGWIEAKDLAAVNRGRQLVWRQPIRVTLDAHDGPRGPIVETLRCDSDFLNLHASGAPEQLTASATFDLNRLADQLGGFVDLGSLRLAGGGWAQLNWQQSQTNDFQADGELQARDFELAFADQPSWTKESLTLTLAATGRTDFTSDTRIDTAALKLQAGPERLEAGLTQPVLDLQNGGHWPVEIHSSGELARLSARIAPWVPLGEWNLAGAYELTAEATGSKTAIHVRRAQLTVGELQVEGPNWNVREPRAELIVSGGWDHDRGRLELASATLSGAGLSAQADNVVCTFSPEGSPDLTGSVAYRGSLDKLEQWTRKSAQPPPWHLLGQFSGKAELHHSAGMTAARIETTIADLIATHQSGRQFHEAHIQLSGRGAYDAQGQSIHLEQAALRCGTLGLDTAGRIALTDGQTNLELAGQLDYDMEKISELLRLSAGEGIRVSGAGSSPVSYRGSLAPEAAQADGGLAWTEAELYGFLVGPGELRARLSGGMLQIQPLDADLSEGRLRLASQVRLAPEPMELYVEPGRVAEQVRINPRMCAGALQYIAPVLAGIATAEGRFSIELDACRIPLADPDQGELAGRMTIHSAQIGPGPLIEELAVLLGRASPGELGRESVISFQMVDGRVHHRGLELVFPDLTIRTRGSVGLDQSLAIIAEMPIPPKWRGGHEMVDSALGDQTIRVPIGGTLTKPKIDRKRLKALSRRFLEDTTRNVLEDGLNRGLQHLFGPPQ